MIQSIIRKFACAIMAIMLCCGIQTQAQNVKSQTAFRLLKTATSLMEAQQFEAAEAYFKKGLDRAKATGDLYSMAYGNEELGNLYTKMDQTQKAITCYQTSIRLYKAQKMPVVANIVETLLKSAQGIGDLYAGIEIGAKGVKMSVIDIKLSKDREFGYTLYMDTAINSDAASLSYESEKVTAETLGLLCNIVKNRFQIPAKRVFVVISSGLKQELDKYNKVDYFANIIRPKEMDPSIKITSITPNQEAELSFMGIVPQRNRFTTDQIDVGSGNTKGGYFNASKTFVPITFPWGTKSFQRLIESKTQGDVKDFVRTAEEYWKDSLRTSVINEFNNKRDFKTNDVLYLSGGIVWSIASLLHPQNVNNTYTELSSNDISEFRRLLTAKYEDLIHPDITLISNADDGRAALKNINRVLKTYDQKAMLAGTIWLDELIKVINNVNPAKKIIYPKYAYVGWISGYIIKKVTQQYTGLVN